MFNANSIRERLPSWLCDAIDRHGADLRQFVEESAQAIPANSLLVDAGAGESQYRDAFPHVRYIGMDFGVGNAEWDYSQLDVSADLHRFPLADNSVDAILCTQVLEHVRHPSTVIAEIARVLKPGGCVYLTAPQGWGEHQQPHDFYRFTSFALHSMFQDAGLINIQIKPMGGFFVYLGNRVAQMPKYLFSCAHSRLFALLLLPLRLVCMAVFSAAVPILCNSLDRLDHRQEYTLGYACTACKP